MVVVVPEDWTFDELALELELSVVEVAAVVDARAVAVECPGMVAALTAARRATLPAAIPATPTVSLRSRRRARSRELGVGWVLCSMASREPRDTRTCLGGTWGFPEKPAAREAGAGTSARPPRARVPRPGRLSHGLGAPGAATLGA